MNFTTDGTVVNRMGLVSTLLSDLLQQLAQGISKRVTLMHQVQYQPTSVVNKIQKGTRLPSKTIVMSTSTDSEISMHIWKDYPRKEIFYEASLIALGKLVQQSSLEDIIRLVLSFLPSEECKILPKSISPPSEEFSFNTFLKRTGSPNYGRSFDIAYIVIQIMVTDYVAYLMNFYDGTNLEPTLAKKLVELALYFQIPPDPKFALHGDFVTFMWDEKICKQWTTILSAATAFGMAGSPTDLVTSLTTTRKESDLLRYYRALRFIQLNLREAHQEAVNFVSTISDMIENCRNKSHRSYLIEILDGGLRSIVWKDDKTFQAEILNLQSKIAKWVKIDELEGLCLRLGATCLSHGPDALFEAEYDEFVSRKVLRKNWKTHSRKDQFLEAILVLLQGEYKGKRIHWQPTTANGYQAPLWTHPSPSSICPLNETKEKVSTRLRALSSAIFQKALLKTPDKAMVDVCLRIFKQISAHSIQFSKAIIIPMIVSEKTVIHGDRIVAFAGFFDMLHQVGEFTRYCFDIGQQHAILYRELQLRFNTCFEEALKGVGPDTYAMITLPRYPRNYYPSRFDVALLRHFSTDSRTGDPAIDYHQNCVNFAIQRFLYMSEESYPQLHIAQAKSYADRCLCEAVANWCGASNLPMLECEYTEQLTPLPTSYRVEYKDQIPVELANSIVKCLQICKTTKFMASMSEAFFGHLILHPNQKLADTTAKTLQWFIMEYPGQRSKIIIALCQTTLENTEVTTAGMETILSNLIFLIGIWISVAKTNTIEDNPDPRVCEYAEALALVNLCHASSSVRGLAIQLIHSVYGLFPANTQCMSALLFKKERVILEKARFNFLRRIAHGNTDSIKIQSYSPLPSLEIASMSHNYILWAYILKEIFILVTEEHLPCIAEARNTVFLRRLSSTNAKLDDSVTSFSEASVARANYHILMLATSDSSNSGKIPHLSAFHEYLTSYWNNLQSDNDFVLEEMNLVIGSVHYSIIHQIIESLLKYYMDLGRKTKPKVHQSFAHLISRIVASDSFSQIIKLGDLSSCESAKSILHEMSVTLESFSMQPRSVNGPLVLYFAQTISSFCNAMQKGYLFCHNGPLRVNLFSSIAKGFHWPVKDRQRLFDVLASYGAPGNRSSTDFKGKSGSITKEPRQDTEYQYQLIQKEADAAFSALVHIGPLFVDQNVPIEPLNWATRIDRRYHTLRSLLSFQFKSLLLTFVNSSYKHPKSDLYIHAIFDQFVQPNTDGVPPWQICIMHSKHQQALEHRQRLIPKREILATNRQDQEFTEIIQEHVGVFIFLLFMNLVHPDVTIRQRATQVTLRLVPIHFGKEQSRPPSEETQNTLEQLKKITTNTSSQLMEAVTKTALELSKITAQTCHEFTSAVFKEAFTRMPTISSDTQKFWALEFLLPWCDHINLTSMDNVDEFLHNILQYLTHDITQSKFKIPAEIIVFWQRLASAQTSNHSIIVDFLINNIQKPSCRILIIYLYQLESTPSLDHLVHPLTYLGNVSFFQGNPTLRYNLFSRKEEARKRMKLCSATIVVLSDFVVDLISQLLPFLHVVLTWTLLLYNNPQEQATLSQLLSNVVQSLRSILQTNDLITDGNNILERLNHILAFMAKDYRRNLKWKHNPHRESIMEPKTPLESAEMIEMCGQQISGQEVISTLLECFQLMSADDLIEAWMEEVLMWATSKFPYSLSLTALEIFNELQTKISVSQVNTLLRYFTNTMSLLQGFIDQHTSNIIHSNRFEPSKVILLTTPIPTLRCILLEILSIFHNNLPQLIANGTHSSVLNIFWIVVHILRITHPAYRPLRAMAMKLSKTIAESDLYSSVSSALIQSQERELTKSQDWMFSGIFPLTVQALYCKDTEAIAVSCIEDLLTYSGCSLVLRMPDKCKGNEFRIILASVLPWIHSSIYSKQVHVGEAESLSVTLINSLLKFSETQQTVRKKRKSVFIPLQSVLSKFTTGCYNTTPDKFLSDCVELLCRKANLETISTISDILSSVLDFNGSLYSISITKTSFYFIEFVGQQNLTMDFINMFRFCTTNIGMGGSQQSLLLNCIGNSQHNVVPGAAPAQPLKMKQTQMVSRFSPSALNFLFGMNGGEAGVSKVDSAKTVRKYSTITNLASPLPERRLEYSASPPSALTTTFSMPQVKRRESITKRLSSPRRASPSRPPRESKDSKG